MTAKKKPIEDLVEEKTPEVEDLPVVPGPVAVTVEIITAEDGDSYASLATRYAPKGVRVHDFAMELLEFNNGATVRPGARIQIKH